MLFNVIYVFCQVSWGWMNHDESVQLLGQRMLLHHMNWYWCLQHLQAALANSVVCIGLDMDFSCFFHASRALAWICTARTCKKTQCLWKVSTQAAYTRRRAQGNSGVPLKAVGCSQLGYPNTMSCSSSRNDHHDSFFGWGPPLCVHPKISEDAVPMGTPNPLMNHNCSYWNGNFRFFGEYAIRIMLQSQTHVVDYTINSNRWW